jgi:hypothetical protein
MQPHCAQKTRAVFRGLWSHSSVRDANRAFPSNPNLRRSAVEAAGRCFRFGMAFLFY